MRPAINSRTKKLLYPPHTVEEARTRRQQCAVEIRKITLQLEDKTRRDDRTRYPTPEDYETWRGSARNAQKLYRLEDHLLYVWTVEHLLQKSYDVLKELEIEVDFEPRESEHMRVLDEHFAPRAREESKGAVG